MKHICPHCQKPGASNAALRWSTRESPAQCCRCAGLSHVLASTSSGIGVFTWMTLIGGLVLGGVLGSVGIAVAAVRLDPCASQGGTNRPPVSAAVALVSVVAALLG